MKDIELRDFRKDLGLTQTELAERVGVSMRTVQNWEKGINKIPQSTVSFIRSLKKDTDFSYSTELTENSVSGVPFYDVDFTAGFLLVENSSQSKPDSYITHPFFKGCDCVVRSSGQSMAKVIAHGDAIGLIKIENWMEFFPYGEIYAIITKEGFRMIKVVTKGETPDSFTLISKPTESKKEEFPPQQIKKSSILAIFKVQASSHLF